MEIFFFYPIFPFIPYKTAFKLVIKEPLTISSFNSFIFLVIIQSEVYYIAVNYLWGREEILNSILNKCIAINILNERFPPTYKLHSIYQVLEVEKHSRLDKVFEIHFIELSQTSAIFQF